MKPDSGQVVAARTVGRIGKTCVEYLLHAERKVVAVDRNAIIDMARPPGPPNIPRQPPRAGRLGRMPTGNGAIAFG